MATRKIKAPTPITLEAINVAIEDGIKRYVNGKIDRLHDKVDNITSQVTAVEGKVSTLAVDFNNHKTVVEPIIQKFNDSMGFKRELSRYSKVLIAIVGTIGAAMWLLNWTRDTLDVQKENEQASHITNVTTR